MNLRLLLRFALLPPLLALGTATAAAQAGTSTRMLADRHGLTREEDALSGRITLRGSGVIVHLGPGLARMLFNDRVETLPAAPVATTDDLVVPEISRVLLEALVERSLRKSAPPAGASAARSAPIPRSASAPRPRSGPGGRVVIDAGHGGPHTGTKSAAGTLEKTVTLDISRRLQNELQERGWQVHMTRQDDRALSSNVRTDLDLRAKFTQELRPDLFVSIHANHSPTRSVRGCEVFLATAGTAARHVARSRRLAEEIDRGLRGLGIPSRGVKTAAFYVIKNAGCPGVLVETEFLSNAEGERLLKDAGMRQRIAESIADGVVRYRQATMSQP